MVQLHDSGACRVEGQMLFYIEMELIEGQDLAQALRPEAPPFTLSRSLEIAMLICQGLRASDFVHGDLKPSNIMLTSNSLKLIDPLSSLDNLFMGTLKYMSPEQLKGLSVDKRSDIYSLGLILHEMIYKKVPFEAEGGEFFTTIAQYSLHRKHDIKITEPHLPPPVRSLLETMLKAEMHDRIQSFDEIISEIKILQEQIPALLQEWDSIESQIDGVDGPPTVRLSPPPNL